MKAMCRAALIIAAFVFLLPLSARSEIKEGSFEVGPFGGYNFFENRQNLKDHPVFGGRFGYNFTKYFGIEGAVEHIRSRVDDKSITGAEEGQFRSPMHKVRLTFYHLDAVYHFMPDGNFNPFVLAGFGGAHYSPEISDKDMAAFNVGVGAKYWMTDDIAFRFDVRDYMVTEIFEETYHNIGATIGMTVAFGGREKPVPVQAEKIEAKPQPIPPPPPPPPPPPTCELKAAPKEIEQGQSATLRLITSGEVKSAALDGTMVEATGGTKTVSPTSTTSYTAKVANPGGSTTCSVNVTVTVPPPPPPAARVIDRLTIHVNFDFDKSIIRNTEEAELNKAIDFVRKYPDADIELEGHTDSKGTDQYNQKLSERRAEAVKQYLIKEGAVDKARISAKGYGESRPIAPNKTEDGKDNPEGRAENRRVEVLIISD